MKRVFLAGTTTGTTWRQELIERLIQRGVRPDQIINPHLPHGARYTAEHARLEREAKSDPETLVLVYVCPAVVDSTQPSPIPSDIKAELLGPISMLEIGKFAWSQSHRTGIVLQYDAFTEGRRPRKVLENLAIELREDFGSEPPYLESLASAEDWIVEMLVA